MSSIHARADEIPVTQGDPPQIGGGSVTCGIKMVYGPHSSMMLGTRPPGYHSAPHLHDREQWNYAISGEMWLFVDGKGNLVKPGDFCRIPANAIHWAWNRSNEESSWVEVHIPGNQGNSLTHGGGVPLFADYEDGKADPTPPTIFIDQAYYKTAEIEERAIAEYEASLQRA
jgi:quercetin dioxygenase-like cupin family protein